MLITGTLERCRTANQLVSNAVSLRMQLHDDHHRRPVPFYHLQNVPGSPRTPAPFTAMMSLAMLPPLWFAVMNPRVRPPPALRHLATPERCEISDAAATQLGGEPRTEAQRAHAGSSITQLLLVWSCSFRSVVVIRAPGCDVVPDGSECTTVGSVSCVRVLRSLFQARRACCAAGRCRVRHLVRVGVQLLK